MLNCRNKAGASTTFPKDDEECFCSLGVDATSLVGNLVEVSLETKTSQTFGNKVTSFKHFQNPARCEVQHLSATRTSSSTSPQSARHALDEVAKATELLYKRKHT